jgi:hypothetical protein
MLNSLSNHGLAPSDVTVGLERFIPLQNPLQNHRSGSRNSKLLARSSAYAGVLATDPDLAGNDRSSARLITLGSKTVQFQDLVGKRDRKDVYRFDVTVPSDFDLKLKGLTANADIKLLNQNGKVLVRADRSGTRTELIRTNLGAGTYFVEVSAASHASTNYKLNLKLDPLKLLATTDDNRLIAFNPDRPQKAFEIGKIRGLAQNDRLVQFDGIDFRPASGKLFALSQQNRLYTLDRNTAVATPFGDRFSPGLQGTNVGIDFNPVPNLLRVVTSTSQNFRLNPNETTGTVTVVTAPPADQPLSFDRGDSATGRAPDANADRTPSVVATAYRNNRSNAAMTPQRSTQFGIDSELDVLVRQGSPTLAPISPNTGLLFTVGSLGHNFGADTAFDITTDANGVDTAFATSGSKLFTINLDTGAAKRLGTVRVNGQRAKITGLSVAIAGY